MVYQHRLQQNKQTCWWKISTACHNLQFVFGPWLGKGCWPLHYSLVL